jgi:hypothetical protein
MANTVIQLRSSGVTGNVPSTLQPGELAINFVDGKLFYGNAVSSVVEFSTTTPAGLNGELQFNSFGDLGATSNVRYDSSSGILYVNNVVANTLVNSVLTDAYNKAQGAYDLANTLSGGTSTDGWARTAANSASSYANSAFNTANTASINAYSSGDYANSAFIQANSAYGKANTVELIAQGAFNTANSSASSGSYANSAYNQANTATNNASVADQRAVTSGVYANSAYATANSVTVLAQSAFDKANTTSNTSTFIITGAQYIDYGWINQQVSPVSFDYGTL